MVDWNKEFKLFGNGASKPVPEDEGAEKTPWYKKEVSLGRSSQKPTDDEPSDDAPKTPWYKKELSLKRAPDREPEPADELPPPAPALPAEEPDLEPAAPLAPQPVAAEASSAPAPAPAPELVAPPAPEPVLPEPPAAAAPPVSWVDAVLQGMPVPVEPEPPSVVEAEVPALPEPVAAVELPAAVAQPAPPAPAPVLPLPEPVAAGEPISAPDPRPVNPPVRAHELPELEDEPPVVPWYKRDLSVSRKAKRQKPFAVPEAAAVEAAPDEKPKPFWKRELSLKRGPRPEAVAKEKPASVKPTSVPFWKKELGRKKPKADPASDGAAAAIPQASKPAAQPFWKRGISLPTLTLPGRSSRSSLPKQLVGLKVGASQLAAARVANNGHAEVLQVAREALDQGVVVGGELRDPDALAEALKEFFRRNKLSKKAVRLGIANNRIGVRTFDIAGIQDQKQLANAIRFRAQEALPIPIEDAVLDYQVLSESVNDEGETVRKILLVVAYRDLVDRYALACRKAGITLVGIDLEAFALLRALAAPPEEGQSSNAAIVAVAVGHDRSTFAVSDGRVCEFTRVLDWGGQNLSVAIARVLDLTPSQADPVKHALSLSGGPAPEGLSDAQLASIKEAVVRQVSTFARELVSSLQFYQAQPNSLGIGEIVLTGGTAHLDGFAAELEKVIGVRVRVGDPLVRVKVPKRFREPEQLGSLAVAIGLGIED